MMCRTEDNMAKSINYDERDQDRENSCRMPYVALYSKSSLVLDTLQRATAEVMPNARVERYYTVGSMGEALRRAAFDCAIAVIVASDKEELREIAALRPFLWGLRTIVVLSDGDEETISLAHSLGPRFVSNAEDGFLKVTAVLNKMLEDHNVKSNVG
jgi:hypothetical protein